MNNSATNPIVFPQYVGRKGVLFKADCLDLLANVRSGTIDVVFADPPFNLNKTYESLDLNDSLSEEAYRGWCRTWIVESLRVLKPGGALFIYHWPKWLMDLGAWLNMVPRAEYRSWIALKMKNGFPAKGRLHPAHYGLLYYTKSGGERVFNVVRSQSPVCRKCGALHRDYGGYRDKYKKYEDSDGIPWIQLSDFWEDTRPATHDKARAKSINELPIHLPERAILMTTKPGAIVLDCFSGSGSTLHAAERNNRYWIAGDIGDSVPALQRLTGLCGPAEMAQMPRKLASVFRKEFRDCLNEMIDSSSRPVTNMKAIQAFKIDGKRFASKSRVCES